MTPKLAEKAESLGDFISREYWENVPVWLKCADIEIENTIQKLLEYKRGWEIISSLSDEEIIENISIRQRLHILKGALFNSKKDNSFLDFYNFNRILLSIDDDDIQDTEFEKEILEIEGFLFKTLKEHLNPGEELHIERALK